MIGQLGPMIKTAQELGISVPDELKVIGYDNLLYRKLLPPTGDHQQPLKRDCPLTVDLLLQKIEGAGRDNWLLLPVTPLPGKYISSKKTQMFV